MTDTITLLGNNLAIVIGAFELAKAGKKVALFTDGKRLGGHFGGVHFSGLDFDIGMVTVEMVEPRLSGEDILTYNHHVRNDWTRFADQSNAWLKKHANLTQAPTTYCRVEGQELPDYLLTNRLDGLSAFDIAPPDALAGDDERHPSHKSSPGLYDTLTYADAAVACHGAAFHDRFIEPFVVKLAGKSSSDLQARFHRGIWVPLYYPDTLAAAFAGEAVTLPEYPFWSTADGCVAAFVQSICRELEDMANVEINHTPVSVLSRLGDDWTLKAGGGRYVADKLALGFGPTRLAELLNIDTVAEIDSLPLSVLFTRVRAGVLEDRPACLMIADTDFASYRYTDQDAFANIDTNWHRVVLEASTDSVRGKYSGQSIEAAMMDELVALLAGPQGDLQATRAGVQTVHCASVQNALTIPTQRSVDALSEAATKFAQTMPDTEMTGSLLGYGVTSMNDQIVQGLKIAKRFGGQ